MRREHRVRALGFGGLNFGVRLRWPRWGVPRPAGFETRPSCVVGVRQPGHGRPRPCHRRTSALLDAVLTLSGGGGRGAAGVIGGQARRQRVGECQDLACAFGDREVDELSSRKTEGGPVRVVEDVENGALPFEFVCP
ncbi:hypothetical protein Pd630_LPD14016 (plasmid) [Rhodococcus opacus PD630]|nr:hypothetical protein Pd630_LPD14016 [Rhodococcus opacus PD630]